MAERCVLLGFGPVPFGLVWSGLALDLIMITVAVLTDLTAIQRTIRADRYACCVPLG
jgi:hypothetical protein